MIYGTVKKQEKLPSNLKPVSDKNIYVCCKLLLF